MMGGLCSLILGLIALAVLAVIVIVGLILIGLAIAGIVGGGAMMATGAVLGNDPKKKGISTALKIVACILLALGLAAGCVIFYIVVNLG